MSIMLFSTTVGLGILLLLPIFSEAYPARSVPSDKRLSFGISGQSRLLILSRLLNDGFAAMKSKFGPNAKSTIDNMVITNALSDDEFDSFSRSGGRSSYLG